MGLSAEQEQWLKDIFLNRNPYPTDLARTVINSFMNEFLAEYKNAMAEAYFKFLKKKAPENWFEVLLAKCPHDTSYTASNKEKFLSDMKRLKKQGQLSDYECAKRYMQGGAHRLVKDRFIMDLYEFCDHEYKTANQSGGLDTIRKINLVLTRMVLLANSLSGVRDMLVKICTDAKDKSKNGTPRKSELKKLHDQPFFGSQRNIVRMAANIDKDSGVLECLAPFKVQFDGCINIKDIPDAQLRDDFWGADGQCKDTIISLIARLKKLLECYESERSADFTDTNKSKIKDFREIINALETYFFKYSVDFSKLYISLERDANQPEPVVASVLPPANTK